MERVALVRQKMLRRLKIVAGKEEPPLQQADLHKELTLGGVGAKRKRTRGAVPVPKGEKFLFDGAKDRVVTAPAVGQGGGEVVELHIFRWKVQPGGDRLRVAVAGIEHPGDRHPLEEIFLFPRVGLRRSGAAEHVGQLAQRPIARIVAKTVEEPGGLPLAG